MIMTIEADSVRGVATGGPAPIPYGPVPVVTPREISNAVLFLASDEARYITGVAFPVDAGNANKP